MRIKLLRFGEQFGCGPPGSEALDIRSAEISEAVKLGSCWIYRLF
jgi:hypothetical protein